MKKFTFTLLVLMNIGNMFGQTFTTGTITFPAPLAEYSVKIDVSPTLVTLTQIMSSDRWYSLAFNNASMNVGDIVAFINTANISDRQLGGFFVPPADGVQSWTTTSNTISGPTRTVISTRVLNTGEAGDYVFSNSAGSINLACSRAGAPGFTLASHDGTANAIRTSSYGITLGNKEFEKQSFKMYPNPSKSFITIEMPAEVITKGELKIYDSLGRVVIKQNITELTTKINTDELSSGSYIVVIRTDYGNSTNNLIIN